MSNQITSETLKNGEKEEKRIKTSCILRWGVEEDQLRDEEK